MRRMLRYFVMCLVGWFCLSTVHGVNIEVSGSSQYLDIAYLMDKLNAIRYEAYEQKLVSDYQPLSWDNTLAAVALNRAIEASLLFEHIRPNGQGFYTLSVNGVSSQGECLANYQNASRAIDSWRKEHDYHGIQSHYELMIDPDFCYVGLAEVTNQEGIKVVAMELSSRGQGGSDQRLGDYCQMIELDDGFVKDIELEVRNDRLCFKDETTLEVKGVLDSSHDFNTSKVKLQQGFQINFASQVNGSTLIAPQNSCLLEVTFNHLKKSQMIHVHQLAGETLQEASCLNEGRIKGRCACSYQGEAILPKKEHEIGNEMVIQEAQCDKEGLSQGVCLHCHQTFIKTLPRQPHHQITKIKKEATCTKEGILSIACKDCGFEIEERTLPRQPHDYMYMVISQPTCLKLGKKKGICQECLEACVIEDVGCAPHQVQSYSYIFNDYQYGFCKDCGSVVKVKNQVEKREEFASSLALFSIQLVQ